MVVPSDTGYTLGRPVHTKLFPNWKRLPASIHDIPRRSRRSRGTHPPRRDVSVHDGFGDIERFVVHTDELPARLRAAASDDTLEGRPVGKQSPGSVVETESESELRVELDTRPNALHR